MNQFSKGGSQSQPSYCHIITSKGIYNLPLEDILFIECFQKKSILHTKTDTLFLPLPLYHFLTILPPPFFLQTHRSFIINLKNVSYIDRHKDPWIVSFFSCQTQALISRSYRRVVMAAMTLLD